MSTIELPDELAARLSAEAARRGVSVQKLLADTFPTPGAGTPRTLGFIGVGESTSGRTAREADEMLADGFGR